MTDKLTRLELTWPGKEDRFTPEPRILLEDKEKSYSKPVKQAELLESVVKPTYDNMLIHGDNLLALKALEQDYTGKVKCIYIDPPYNTGNAFEHYDDGLEHSIWLSLMRDRLEILKNLLSEDGSIWISIDENEAHYLKVLCDEIFGRKNFIIMTSIKRGAATGHKAINPTPVQVCDLMLTYAKDKDKWVYHPVYRAREYDRAYSQFIENYDENYEKWNFIPLKQAMQKYNFTVDKNFNKYAERIIRFAQPDYNAVGQETRRLIDLSKNSDAIFLQKRENNPDIYLYKGNRILFYKDKLHCIDGKLTTAELVTNIWDDMNYQGIAREGSVTFARSKKPEAQVKRIFEMSTNPGDLVLDSFLGSGTTAAVAQKMGRRWIGVEMGDHVYTHCIPRLHKVIDGEDLGGITKAVNWQGGGGFKFYELASSLIVKDKYGQQIISDKYNADMLAEAMCKILGYHYKPDAEKYWKQGYSSEKSFIYTTTMSMQEESLGKLAAEVGDDNLLICCSAFIGNKTAYPNITVKKIPAAILKKCEWGREGYPLNLKDYKPTDEDFEFEDSESED